MFQVLLQTLRQSESMLNIIRTLRKIHELGSICSQKKIFRSVAFLKTQQKSIFATLLLAVLPSILSENHFNAIMEHFIKGHFYFPSCTSCLQH